MSGGESPVEVEQDHELDQWWTGRNLARWLVAWAGLKPGMNVIEPAAGAGAIAREISHDVNLTCVEIDARLALALEEVRVARPPNRTRVIIADALRLGWSHRFDVLISNTPYSKPIAGIDSLFAAKALEIADRTVLLVSESFFHTKRRYERVWSKCRLTRVAHFVERPSFTVAAGKPGPMTDYVAVELVPGFGVSCATHEWVRGFGGKGTRDLRKRRVRDGTGGSLGRPRTTRRMLRELLRRVALGREGLEELEAIKRRAALRLGLETEPGE